MSRPIIEDYDSDNEITEIIHDNKKKLTETAQHAESPTEEATSKAPTETTATKRSKKGKAIQKKTEAH